MATATTSAALSPDEIAKLGNELTPLGAIAAGNDDSDVAFDRTIPSAYDLPNILVVGAVVSVVAYRVMVRLGRLPEDARVMS